MRTKTLLLAAALSAAGVAASLAQVYSVNAVGYINVNLAAGYNLIANQLNASPSNSLEVVFGNALGAGDTVFKFNGTSFDSAIYAGSGTFIYSGTPFGLKPGEGAFVQTGTAKTVTFVGEVPQGTALLVPLPAGYSIVSSIVPQSLPLGDIGFPVQAGDTVFFYTGTGFDTWIAADATGQVWLPSNPNGPPKPTPAVGQAFFVQRGGAPAPWFRNFSVNQ